MLMNNFSSYISPRSFLSLSQSLSTIKNVKNNPKLLDSLYVTNSKSEKIFLHNNIPDILNHQGLPLIDESKYDVRLFKLQLWLEEQMITIPESNQYLINYGHILKKLKTKFKYGQDLNKIDKSFPHEIDSNFGIICVVIQLYNYNAQILTATNTIISIGDKYVYRMCFKPLNLNMSYIQYKELYEINSNKLHKVGEALIKPFTALNLISGIVVDTNETHYLSFDIHENFKDMITNTAVKKTSIPMISKPQDWVLNGSNYHGGYYRHDLFDYRFVHHHGLYDHKIDNVESIQNNVNYQQSQHLNVNTSKLNYIQNNNIELSQYDNDIFKIAKLFDGLDIFVPLYIDWRARIYTYSNLLSYQGKSLARSQLQNNIYNSAPLDSGGFLAFVYFVSVIFGLSIESNYNRVSWFNLNKNRIYNMDPTLLNEANPNTIYEFINLCQSYKKFVDDPQSPFTNLVNFDATCSGIQHISGILQDESQGKLVNIENSNDYEKPSDIYTYFIPMVLKEFEKESINYPYLKNLEVNRSIIKGIIKTIPYNVTLVGICNQLINKMEVKTTITTLNGKKIKKTVYVTRSADKKNDIILSRKDVYNKAKIIRGVIVDNCTNLNKLKDYYGNMTSLLITCGIPVTWQPKPNGVVISQNYLKSEKVNYTYRIGIKRHTIILNKVKLPKIVDKSKSRKAIVPNIIHSLDSFHMISIVNKFHGKTIFTIHDCFVIHPNDYTLLKNEFINTFVSLYFDHDFLNTYHNTVLKKIEERYNIIFLENKKCIKVNSKKIIIPVNPSLNNKEMSKNVYKSNYMIK